MKLEQREDGLFYVTFRTIQGSDETICTNKSTLEEAQRIVADAKIEEVERASEARILSAQVMGRILVRKDPTVNEAFQEFVEWMDSQSPFSAHTKRMAVSHVGEWISVMGLGNKQVSLLEPVDVSKFINYPDERKYSSRQVIRSRIHTFLRYCVEKGYLFFNPAATVRVDHRLLSHDQKEKRPIVLFTEPEIQTILSRTTGFWHAAVALAFYTGLRISDIVYLEWACFHEPDCIVIWTRKTNTRCVIPLPLEVQQALEHVKKEHEKYVFPAQRLLYEASAAKFSWDFTVLCDKLGLGRRSFHALRHTYVTRCRAAGVPVSVVSSRVGHRSTYTTDLYTHAPRFNIPTPRRT